MESLRQILGYGVRTELLRVMRFQPAAIGVRQAARIAGVGLRSVQLALAKLVADGLVTRRIVADNRPVYELNREHPDLATVKSVVDAMAEAEICRRSQFLHHPANAILPFIEEAVRLLDTARESKA